MLHPAHRRRRLLNRLKTAVGVVLAIAVCGLAVVFALGKAGFIDLPKADDGTDASLPGFVPMPETPFEGTPTADWKEFGDLAWPEAKSTGHFTRKQVEGALKDVKDILWAGRVDWAAGKIDPEGFQGLFAPDARKNVGGYLEDDQRLHLVSELDAGASLASPPRVTGTVSFSESTDEHGRAVLRITTNLVWAYGFTGDLVYYGDHLIVLNLTQNWEITDPDDIARTSQGVWLGNGGRAAWQGLSCDGVKRGVLALEPPMTGDGTADPNAERIWEAGSDTSVFTNHCK
ncbi:hypothetical protein Afil01_12200 [Actinorhabdospora filicis]|uniref:Uncharacterized protein n=1 Tax=Actinorhabdospora filicis TaxID=1785913 RepID=A0A9W6SHJ6_9ACTN|nr:hypothetical protein [Actinorhabdospora filicis]GLZ76413.1 hypothetical protein Afil01_12200 [Actinorhabdospora filicis]